MVAERSTNQHLHINLRLSLLAKIYPESVQKLFRSTAHPDLVAICVHVANRDCY
jgi:hypothetical protein